MLSDIEKIMFSNQQIDKRVKELAQQINEDYKGKSLVLLCILKGSTIFFADLLREITVECRIDFLAVSSYEGGMISTGEVKILKDIDMSLLDCDVLIVEDILDSGRTLNYITKLLEPRKPRSVKICALIDKPSKRKVDIKLSYCGFTIPDEFVVGYGTDYEEKYRNLPFLGILKESIYSK